MKRTVKKGRRKEEKRAGKRRGKERGTNGNGARARREKVKNGAENGRGRALAEKRGHIRIPRGKSGDVLIKREKRKAHGREKSGKNAKNIEISKKIIFKTFDMGGGYGVMIYKIYKLFVQQVYELYV